MDKETAEKILEREFGKYYRKVEVHWVPKHSCHSMKYIRPDSYEWIVLRPDEYLLDAPDDVLIDIFNTVCAALLKRVHTELSPTSKEWLAGQKKYLIPTDGEEDDDKSSDI